MGYCIARWVEPGWIWLVECLTTLDIEISLVCREQLMGEGLYAKYMVP